MNTEIKEKYDLEEKKNIIKIFKTTHIRTKWDAEKEDYYFSVVDVIVIGALTESSRARKYWSDLKKKLKV